MNAPLVSVCMTTYNHEHYIAQAIESILAQQTDFDVEVVVGEDCSTDATATICRDFAVRYGERVRLVTSPNNVGMRANYRRTIDACRGRYVAMCDGDDWWSDPHKLQHQVELMEADPACGMCYTRALDFYQATSTTQSYPDTVFTRFEELLCRTTIANCTTLARRDLITAYYTEICPEEHPEWQTDDWPMWLWFAHNSQIRFLDRVTAHHRRLAGSVSHSVALARRVAFRDSLMSISCWFDARYTSGRHRPRIERRRSGEVLWMLSWEGTLGQYLARWWVDVVAYPRLLLCPEGPGLLVKKILFRRTKNMRS